MSFFWLIVCALAAFRLAELVVVDDGPFDVFFHLRGWANKPPTGTPVRGMLAGALSCVHCAGIWMALLAGLLYASQTNVLRWILFILAVAGLQSILVSRMGRTS